jgi:hypothetical protein
VSYLGTGTSTDCKEKSVGIKEKNRLRKDTIVAVRWPVVACYRPGDNNSCELLYCSFLHHLNQTTPLLHRIIDFFHPPALFQHFPGL